MAAINITNMVVLDNPTSFSNPFQFEITFEAISELTEDLEWKVTYVGSAEDSSLDQVLDEVAVGPIPVGVNKFVLQADAPDVSRIQERDVLGVTVVLITCSYMEQEFCRVGYYVNNDYSDPIDLEVGVPSPIDMTKVVRQILADKPRVTRFPINWNGPSDPSAVVSPPPAGPNDNTNNQDEDMAMGDEDDQILDEEDEEDDEEDEDEEDDMLEAEVDLDSGDDMEEVDEPNNENLAPASGKEISSGSGGGGVSALIS